jgi:hypothetical protein
MIMPISFNIPIALTLAAAGTFVALTAYRRGAKRRAPDVRTELRAEQELLCTAIAELRTKIDIAKRSWSGGALPQWLNELDADLSELQLSRSRLPAGDSDYESLSDMDVDMKLVDVFAMSMRLNALADRYGDSISAVETDCETLDEGAEAQMLEAPPYSIRKSTAPIVESVV